MVEKNAFGRFGGLFRKIRHDAPKNDLPQKSKSSQLATEVVEKVDPSNDSGAPIASKEVAEASNQSLFSNLGASSTDRSAEQKSLSEEKDDQLSSKNSRREEIKEKASGEGEASPTNWVYVQTRRKYFVVHIYQKSCLFFEFESKNLFESKGCLIEVYPSKTNG